MSLLTLKLLILYSTQCHGAFYTIGKEGYQKNLTVNNIMVALGDYSVQWLKIADMLDVPEYVSNSILVSRLKDDQASLRRVIKWWFKNNPNPEWSAIEKVKGILVV